LPPTSCPAVSGVENADPWTALAPNTPWSIEASAVRARSNTIFLSGASTLYRSDDAGATWCRLPANAGVSAIFAPQGSHTVYVRTYSEATGNRVSRSDDDGATWTNAGGGLPSDQVITVFPQPQKPTTALAVSSYPGQPISPLFRTDDAGT